MSVWIDRSVGVWIGQWIWGWVDGEVCKLADRLIYGCIYGWGWIADRRTDQWTCR